MAILNFEFKASACNINELEQKLLTLHPIFIGEDHQKDTYYNTAEGRLKLREGNIENALITTEVIMQAPNKAMSSYIHIHLMMH